MLYWDSCFFFQVLGCLTSGVDIDNMNICDSTAKTFSQLIFEEKLKINNDGNPVLNNM